MPMLLYCVAQNVSGQGEPLSGVAGVPVLSTKNDSLEMFYSRHASSDIWTTSPVPESVTQFHRVLMSLFNSRAVIPFRYPTILDQDDELVELLDCNAVNYAAQLEKFAADVQMEALITLTQQTPATAVSGTQYLQSKLEQRRAVERTSSALQQLVEGMASGWKTRSLRNGAHLFALVKRDSVKTLIDRVHSLVIPCGLNIRITGPWPVTEFLEIEDNSR
jgi:hypothetical protein